MKTPVTVFGPTGIQEYWRYFLVPVKAYIELKIAGEGRPDLERLVGFEILEDGKIVRDGGITVSAMRNIHPPLINTFSLSFESKTVNGTCSPPRLYSDHFMFRRPRDFHRMPR